MPSTSVRRGTGSSANLAGSRVSSTPKNSSGTSTQARTSAVPANAARVGRRSLPATLLPAKTLNPMNAAHRPKKMPRMNRKTRDFLPRIVLRRIRSFNRTK